MFALRKNQGNGGSRKDWQGWNQPPCTLPLNELPPGMTKVYCYCYLLDGRPFVSLECLENTSFGAQWSLFEPNQACNYSGMLTTAATDTLKNLSSVCMPLHCRPNTKSG